MQPEAKCIYVVSCGHYLKIGVAKNVDKRMRALQVGMPLEVKLECLWDVPAETAFKAEACAHRLLAKHRVRGEWFTATLDDVREIEHQVFRRAYKGATFDPDGYEGADRYVIEILAQERFLTLAEQQTYINMLTAEAA